MRPLGAREGTREAGTLPRSQGDGVPALKPCPLRFAWRILHATIPFLPGSGLQRRESMDVRAARHEAGLLLLHYTVFVPVKRGGPEFLDWVGGYFDYETGSTPNHWYSKIQTAETTPAPASPSHPVCRGLHPFKLREEYYYRMRFREPDP